MNRHYIFASSSDGAILITPCATHPGKHLKKRSHRWYTRMTVENKSSDTKWMTSSVAICLLSNLPVAIPITNKKQSRTLMLFFFSHEEMIIDSTEYLAKLQSLMDKTNIVVEKHNAKL